MLVFVCSKADTSHFRMSTVSSDLEAEEWIDNITCGWKDGAWFAVYSNEASTNASKCFMDFCSYVARRLAEDGRIRLERTAEGLRCVSECPNPGLMIIQEVLCKYALV